MVSSSWPVQFTLGAIVVVVFVSGPLVPQVNFTSPPEDPESDFCAAAGGASVTVEDIPTEQFRVEQRDFGAGSYYIAAPDTIVSVENVRGCPILAYRLAIEDLGYLGQRLYFLTDGQNQTVSLSVMEGSFEPSDIGSGPYTGTLSIRLRGDRTRTVYETNVTVRVK